MQAELTTPITRSETITHFEILEYIERPSEKVVQARVKMLGEVNLYTLWTGQKYDQIGQWTDTDSARRINQLIELGVFVEPENVVLE